MIFKWIMWAVYYTFKTYTLREINLERGVFVRFSLSYTVLCLWSNLQKKNPYLPQNRRRRKGMVRENWWFQCWLAKFWDYFFIIMTYPEHQACPLPSQGWCASSPAVDVLCPILLLQNTRERISKYDHTK